MSRIVRAIEAFDPVTEFRSEKWEIDDSLIDLLRPLFDVGDDLEMVFDYAINDDIKDEVSRITGVPLNGPYDYFLSAWARA